MALEDVLTFEKIGPLKDSNFFSETGIHSGNAVKYLEKRFEDPNLDKIQPRYVLSASGAVPSHLMVYKLESGLPFLVPQRRIDGTIISSSVATPVDVFNRELVDKNSNVRWRPVKPVVHGEVNAGDYFVGVMREGRFDAEKLTSEGKFQYVVKYHSGESGIVVDALGIGFGYFKANSLGDSFKMSVIPNRGIAHFCIQPDFNDPQSLAIAFNQDGVEDYVLQGGKSSKDFFSVTPFELGEWALKMKGQRTRFANLVAMQYIKPMDSPTAKIDFKTTVRNLVNAVNNPAGADFANYSYVKFV